MENKLNITLPERWEQLTEKQLHDWFAMILLYGSSAAAKVACALKWSGLRVESCPDGKNPEWTLSKGRLKQKKYYRITESQVGLIASALDWTDRGPARPVRPARIGRRTAVDALFHNVPFGRFIAAESGYQGFLQTRETPPLDVLTDVLYQPMEQALTTEQREMARVVAVWWWQALKSYLTDNFPNLFKPAGDYENDFGPLDAARRFRDSINTQMRALTKGDVSKEAEIEKIDTWRALTELDAPARDYEEMKSRMK